MNFCFRILLIFAWLVLCFMSSFSHATEVERFKVQKSELRYGKYPWGEELALHVEGIAHPMLHQTTLTISVFYEGHRIEWFQIFLEKKADQYIPFQLTRDSLNKAAQEILAGTYLIQVELDISQQEQKIGEQLRKKLGGQEIKKYQKKFNIGTPEQKNRQTKAIQDFYLEKIKILNEIFQEIYDKRREFLKDKSPALSAISPSFGSIMNKIELQRKSLQKHPKQVIVLLYSQTHTNLKDYCDLLENMARNYANAIYRFLYQKSKGEQAKYVEPYGGMGLRNNLNYLRQIHREMAEELSIDFVERLGYFPPPPIFRH